MVGRLLALQPVTLCKQTQLVIHPAVEFLAVDAGCFQVLRRFRRSEFFGRTVKSIRYFVEAFVSALVLHEAPPGFPNPIRRRLSVFCRTLTSVAGMSRTSAMPAGFVSPMSSTASTTSRNR